LVHFTISTGQCAYITTPNAVLPSNSLLKPDLPLVVGSHKISIKSERLTARVAKYNTKDTKINNQRAKYF